MLSLFEVKEGNKKERKSRVKREIVEKERESSFSLEHVSCATGKVINKSTVLV